ncbi:putative bifunctional diguanylate cyclase/phosphodiesterase [Beggiatoa leptomitoformis]|uniref:cyclic-guanylate-specific phosphodiesterase n=1 Tax=Beggiatoa leptomitoformis TaxID=288004 RepID=A0A2N9YCE4_9GAMM|nr:EAL domain-containing protein [Beggiatoa leptomitoformis]ALG66579.1 EAL domain-containing protein [Beggiatoa leptomitoformis]AUI68116.1 EAL domain-containing protein [Beggiatoa leptomitoformis]
MADKSTVLIVDDEIVSRYTVEVLLESEGYNLIFAESGEESLRKAEEIIPDLMLLDVMMPGMDGFEVCQRLRTNPKLAELPIVMITALDDRESRLRGLEVGADDFMSKPFDRAELRARVRTITRLNRYRRLIETEEQLVYLANYDVLTGLPNRNLVLEHLRQSIENASHSKTTFALMSLDLDGVQIINESLGHNFGDLLLKEIAHRLRHLSLPKGTITARMAGDEFLLILQTTQNAIKEASHVAQDLLESIRQPISLAKQHEIVITASVGISIYPSDGEDTQNLLRNANIAMSRAKLQGKNNYQFFKIEMNEAAVKRLVFENQLRKVLEREELCLYYQPQIELISKRVAGLEALLRWENTTLGGMISPDRFIPIAEEMGLIVPIGEWVLQTACKQGKEWLEQGLPPVRIAVNISSRQFQQPGLLAKIKEILEYTRFPAELLEVEVTESLFIGDDSVRNCYKMLKELQEMGVKIAIDDFGTGYSALNYLKRFPVNTLKIDRSFIKDICVDKDDAAITTAIIAMAHSLNLSIIAEGVEEVEQLAFLHFHKCEMAQGYLFSPPVPAKQIEKILTGGSIFQTISTRS